MEDQDYLEDIGVGLPPAPNLPKEAVISGQVVKIEDGYARAVAVGKALVAVVLAGATVARLVILLLAAVLRTQSAGGDGRGWKALRKGPEFLVTPVWIRDTDGLLVEVEVQGYLSGRLLRRRDRVRVTARRQDGRHLPLRAHRIVNLTIGQVFVPRRPTLWTHLGFGLLLQAVFGLLVVATLVVAGWH